MLVMQARLVPRVVVSASFPSWLSTSLFPVDSKLQLSAPSKEVSPPFHFEKSTHILGYTGLQPFKYPRIIPGSFEKYLETVKGKLEVRLLSSDDINKLIFASSTLPEMETTLEFVKKYYQSVFPPNSALSIAIIRAFINMGRPDMALDVIKKPTDFGVFPSSYPLAVLMDAFLKMEQFELALDAFELTQVIFAPINEVAMAVSAFTHICEGSTALFLVARELLLRIIAYEWKYTPDALRVALMLLKRQNRFVQANQLIGEFKLFDTYTFDDKLGELVRDILSSK